MVGFYLTAAHKSLTVFRACTRMTFVTETLLPLLTLAGIGGGLAVWIWGLATNMSGRKAVDATHTAKIAALKAANSTHSTSCDTTHDETRTKLEELGRGQVSMGKDIEHGMKRLAMVEEKVSGL